MAQPAVAESLRNLDLDIEGMTCTACCRRIEKNLNKVEGVHAYVDFATEVAHVTVAPQITREQLVKVVEDAGYSVSSGRSEADSIKWRLLVGAVIAAPLAALSMWPGMPLMNWGWLVAVAALPVATWVAWPFHSVAFKNLKQRTSTMDTLVSLGVVVAYLYSLWQVATGGIDTYFEVAAVVPTVVLLGRWLEVRTRRSATDSVRALMAAIPDNAVVRRDGLQQSVATGSVQIGEIVIVASGQKIPVDGIVFEGAGQVDNALITGESVPEDLAVGTSVAAGAVNLGSTLVLTATAVSTNSRIAQIADLVREASSRKAKITNLTDRISNVFVPTVIILAVLTYLGWAILAGDHQRALRAAIAVLVIACPCALGIAVPMSLAVATSLGARRGIVIRNPDTLNLLGRIRRVVLDKTGTITTGALSVAVSTPIGGFDAGRATRYAAAVERGSVHPVARAISALDQGLTATEITETAGLGVSGMVDGHEVRVSRIAAGESATDEQLVQAVLQAGARTIAVVWVDGSPSLVFGLEDQVRPESDEAIRSLVGLDIEPILLSGDADSRVAAVAGQVGIKTYFAGVTPERKLQVVQDLKASADGGLIAMVGDGLNDVAALAGADVGIAMGSGTHATQSAAAITILDDDPRAIGFAIQLGRRTWSNIRQNLGWAFGYNVILIPVAAFGLLNPMLAGTAMAFSSISVVANALRLRQAQNGS